MSALNDSNTKEILCRLRERADTFRDAGGFAEAVTLTRGDFILLLAALESLQADLGKLQASVDTCGRGLQEGV